MTATASHRLATRGMPYRPLGATDVQVSALCLGTQTFGAQTTEAEAHAQLDLAVAHGVNFVDTAEMYPFPPDATTAGATETIVGNWLHTRRRRHDVVVATKVTSRSAMSWIADGASRLTRTRIEAAVEGSLRRLRTDYVDLYQLHWPDRYTNFFGRLGYAPDPESDFIPLEHQLEVLHDLVRAGKVRHVGVSNETPWGVMTFLRLAETRGWPRVVSIQNPYSLLNRSCEVGLAEVAIRERCGLLAYSPLGFGLLTGKYATPRTPAGARLAQFAHASRRYTAPRALAAADVYVRIARTHGLDPAQMALAFATSRPFVTSTIIGATTPDQLAANIASLDVTLSDEVLHDIETAHDADRYPCP
jgi:aryl-alcohol dehydrogenase-like predicted oxidoreductase